jgi:predicted DNA-binding transcriptional regulator AlpA
MMKNRVIQLYEVDPEEFKKEILEGVEKLLSEFSKQFTPKEPEVWLNRKDVSELLGISLPTIHEWGKLGILKPYKIGTRVRYRQLDIEETLLNSNRSASGRR